MQKKTPDYMDKIFYHAECNRIPTRYSYQKVKLPHCKTTQGLRALSYIGPSLWNNQDKSLKTSASLHSFKHNIKDYYFRKGNNNITNYLSTVSKSLLMFVTLNSLLYF